MTTPDLALAKLRRARNEKNGVICRRLLTEAVKLCDLWYAESQEQRAIVIKSQAQGELAREGQDPQRRSITWMTALRTTQRHVGDNEDSELIVAHAELAIDCYQDRLSDMPLDQRLQNLRRAQDRVNRALDDSEDSGYKAQLLARKAAMLRALSTAEVSLTGRRARVMEALRCATRGHELMSAPATNLELALSEWAAARIEPTDLGYAERARKVEAILQAPELERFEPAQLALFNFYRMTYRQFDCCQTFSKSLEKTTSLRRWLRESPAYAEAVVQLWYSDYPDLHDYLADARSLMESALAAGLRDARVIINLAFVTAILEGTDSAKTSLTEIGGERGWISWREAIDLVADPDRGDTALLGFSLGIDESGILTRLGTFARTFLQDDELAERLYRAATRANPHDAVALTNLARFLVRTGGSLPEAERIIQKAQNFADRRFTWWRPVLAEIMARKSGDPTSEPAPKSTLVDAPKRYTTLRSIKQRYTSIRGLSNSQQRGYELERLFYELAAITFGTAAPSYRIERESGAISQIDGYFEHRGNKYRVECKWQSDPVDHGDVVDLMDKLDVVGVSGLLVSMSGFTNSAIGRARESRKTHAIILMSGEEVEAVLREYISFDEVMNRKRLHFDRNSQPFYLVAPDTLTAQVTLGSPSE